MTCDLINLVNEQINSALWDCCPSEFIKMVKSDSIFEKIKQSIAEDAVAFAKKDPASGRDPVKIIFGYTSFRAVLHYRIANLILNTPRFREENENFSAILSSRGKLLSGADIHYKSSIGNRLILDHGVGTVIGETSTIGDDCYILGGVTLGASGIAGNSLGKRHPTIGNRVQIGAYSRLFGDVTIGDDVFIGPNCVITEDVPARTKVTLKSNLQVHKELAYGNRQQRK